MECVKKELSKKFVKCQDFWWSFRLIILSFSYNVCPRPILNIAFHWDFVILFVMQQVNLVVLLIEQTKTKTILVKMRSKILLILPYNKFWNKIPNIGHTSYTAMNKTFFFSYFLFIELWFYTKKNENEVSLYQSRYMILHNVLNTTRVFGALVVRLNSKISPQGAFLR